MHVVLYMYLKHSTDHIDSKYIYSFMGLTLLGFIVAEIPFLAFLPFTGKGRGVIKWDSSHVTPRVKLYMHTKF